MSRASYFRALAQAIECTEVTEPSHKPIGLGVALERLHRHFCAAGKAGGRLIFIGNGGSAAIASHMAVDFSKNGGVPAIAFNDVATLTALGNDFGYEHIFAKQLDYYARRDDLPVIISSSGNSPNILNAAAAARRAGCRMLVTLSGMDPNNALRGMGELNFYTPSRDYGLVELSHLALLHSIVLPSP